MKYIIVLLTLLLECGHTFAQQKYPYQLNWVKIDSAHYTDIDRLTYNKGTLLLNYNWCSKYTYDGHVIDSIGRYHNIRFWRGQPKSFSSAINVNEKDGSYLSSVVSENNWGDQFSSSSDGDTITNVEIAPYDSPHFPLYVQIRDKQGHFKDKFLDCHIYTRARYGRFVDGYPLGLFPVPSNDVNHVYALMGIGRKPDSLYIDGHKIDCDTNYNYDIFLMSFDLAGNLQWVIDVYDVNTLSHVGVFGTLDRALFLLDESGTGYLEVGNPYHSGNVVGDFFEGGATFIVRISSKGKILNHRFFNFRGIGALGIIAARYSDRFYFEMSCSSSYEIGTNLSSPYEVNASGYVFNDDSQALALNYSVYGEMDTNFNVLWYKILPYYFIGHQDQQRTYSGYNNYISLGLSLYNPIGTSYINDADELIMLGVRANEVRLDSGGHKKLFSGSTGDISMPVIVKLSKRNGFEPLYQFGTNAGFGLVPDNVNLKGILMPPSSQICAHGNAIYASFRPVTGMRMDSLSFKYNRRSYSDTVLVCKIGPDSTVLPDSIYGRQECNRFHAFLAYHSTPDSIHWNWGDGSRTSGDSVEAYHSYSSIGTYQIICQCYFHDTSWSDTLGIYYSAPPRHIEAPDTLIVCDKLARLQVAASPSDSIYWSDGDTGRNKIAHYSGMLYCHIKTAMGCIITDSVMLILHPLPVLSFPDSLMLCPGESYIYHIALDTALEPTWPDGSHADSFIANGESGVTLKIDNGYCDTTYHSTISYRDTTHFFFTHSIPRNGKGIAHIHVPSTIGYLTWPDNTHGQDYSVEKNDSDAVLLKINNGCKTYTVIAHIEPLCPVYAPNVFHPGSAIEQNNYWQPVSPCGYREYHLTIYNRWGERVFQSNDPQESWDGGGCQEGVYYYMLIGRMSDGRNIFLKGNITLVR